VIQQSQTEYHVARYDPRVVIEKQTPVNLRRSSCMYVDKVLFTKKRRNKQNYLEDRFITVKCYLYINVHVEFFSVISPDTVMADFGCSSSTSYIR